MNTSKKCLSTGEFLECVFKKYNQAFVPVLFEAALKIETMYSGDAHHRDGTKHTREFYFILLPPHTWFLVEIYASALSTRLVS